ncbi:hypothetical protein TNCV_4121081 [Trichonephila clavipes]|nr:hypothetical protein TNCV_4121081 [Trichonephila clavipes]
MRSLLDEVETSEREIDQAREEPGEIMDINPYSESKSEKSDEHEMFESKGRFSNATIKKDRKPQDTLRPIKKKRA